MDRANKAGLRTVTHGNQKWAFTLKDIEKIKNVERKTRKNRLKDIVDQSGLSVNTVKKMAKYLGLQLMRDYNKVLWACQKYATGFYTKEGIFYLLKTEYK
jgi:hypothetical protein